MSSTIPLTTSPILTALNASLRPLTTSDAQSCVKVESTFPPHERCSEEKFHYRLTQTPPLSLGLFIPSPSGTGLQQIGHVIATRTCYPAVTDGSMLMPENWRSLPATEPYVLADGTVIGNDPVGKTVAVHSVVVVPEFQRNGVGRELVGAYVEYVRGLKLGIGPGTGVGDGAGEGEGGDGFERVVLIAHDHLIRFYEGVGFVNHGVAGCMFAGGGWNDLRLEL